MIQGNKGTSSWANGKLDGESEPLFFPLDGPEPLLHHKKWLNGVHKRAITIMAAVSRASLLDGLRSSFD